MNTLFSIEGRISRLTYWKYVGGIYLLVIILGASAQGDWLPKIVQALLGLLMLPAMVVGLFAQIKRWHDRNKSGWWVLINFVPCIGGFWSLIECGFLKGTDGPNRFGPDTLQTPLA